MPNRAKRDETRAYGAPIGPARPAPTAERLRPREADPETRRRAIAEHERAAREAARERMRRASDEPAPVKAAESPTRDLSVTTAAKRVWDRRRVIEDAVDEAVSGRPRR